MKIEQLAQEQKAYILEMRRFLHRYPELSWQETNATRKVTEELAVLGFETRHFEGHTGVMGTLRGKQSAVKERTVLLRADLDALPILEQTGLPFASEQPGVMHACGHDCHTAMLLGAARILASLRDQFAGEVRVLFQPAEEINEGAVYCITQGVLDNADAIFGLHVWGDLESPYLSIQSGPRMASCDRFRIRVRGVSAHGGAPHQGVDAIVAASAIVLQAQTIVSRNNDPHEPLVLTIGEIHGGKRFNIIADDVELVGTVRAHSQNARSQVENRLRRLAEHTAQAYGATAELRYDYEAQPVNNGFDDLTELAREAAVKLFGTAALLDMPAAMASEDFAYYMEKIPGVFCFLGAKNNAVGCAYQNHSDRFTADENALVRGVALYAQFAIDFLDPNR